MMHVAFRIFAWVFLRISSSTPQNCPTTNFYFPNLPVVLLYPFGTPVSFATETVLSIG